MTPVASRALPLITRRAFLQYPDAGFYDLNTRALLTHFGAPLTTSDPQAVSYEARNRLGRIVGLLTGRVREGRLAAGDAGNLPGLRWVSQLTLVSPAWRRQGLARALWEVMLATERPTSVRVRAASDRGLTLLVSLQAAHPEIVWDVTPAGARTQRDLKGRTSGSHGSRVRLVGT